ncbi:MAG: MFS transporter [Dehalococcoidia bacterium]|nr:MFS transporter [Dehalococcoidia bacterium]
MDPTIAGPAPARRPWSAFEYRDYRLLWLAGLAAYLTIQLRLLVTGVWLYEETGSAVQLGLLGGVQLVVQLPALLYGGTLADDVDRKRLMASTEAVGLVLIAGLAVLAVGDSLRPWHIYVATAITSVSSVLGGPARNALISKVVPRSHLMHAVTTNNVTQQVAAIGAPLLFAGVAEWVSLTAAFVVTAIVSVPGVLLPLRIRADTRPDGGRTGGNVLRNIWDGVRYVRTHPILPGIYLLDFGVTIVSFYRQILPVLADQLFRGGAGAVGILTAANSMGAVGGSFLVLFLVNYPKKGMLVIYATLIYAVLLFGFGLSTSLWLGAVFIAGLGAMDAVTVTVRHAVVQLTTPDGMLGRALSVQSTAATTANNIGTLEVGILSAAVGASATMVLGGGASVLITLLVWWAVRGIRDYRFP